MRWWRPVRVHRAPVTRRRPNTVNKHRTHGKIPTAPHWESAAFRCKANTGTLIANRQFSRETAPVAWASRGHGSLASVHTRVYKEVPSLPPRGLTWWKGRPTPMTIQMTLSNGDSNQSKVPMVRPPPPPTTPTLPFLLCPTPVALHSYDPDVVSACGHGLPARRGGGGDPVTHATVFIGRSRCVTTVPSWPLACPPQAPTRLTMSDAPNFRPDPDRFLPQRLPQRVIDGHINYTCPDCPFRSRYTSVMVKHVRTHSGEKPFKCSHCDFRASQKYSVVRHEARHEPVGQAGPVLGKRRRLAHEIHSPRANDGIVLMGAGWGEVHASSDSEVSRSATPLRREVAPPPPPPAQTFPPHGPQGEHAVRVDGGSAEGVDGLAPPFRAGGGAFHGNIPGASVPPRDPVPHFPHPIPLSSMQEDPGVPLALGSHVFSMAQGHPQEHGCAADGTDGELGSGVSRPPPVHPELWLMSSDRRVAPLPAWAARCSLDFVLQAFGGRYTRSHLLDGTEDSVQFRLQVWS